MTTAGRPVAVHFADCGVLMTALMKSGARVADTVGPTISFYDCFDRSSTDDIAASRNFDSVPIRRSQTQCLYGLFPCRASATVDDHLGQAMFVPRNQYQYGVQLNRRRTDNSNYKSGAKFYIKQRQPNVVWTQNRILRISWINSFTHSSSLLRSRCVTSSSWINRNKYTDI